jgi:[NiFe] hydrogenase assembly HybE family chaperone
MTSRSLDADALKSRMEAAFQRAADERMADIPILNPALSVAAVGARLVDGAWLTALVTPWCINLMLLPDDPEEAALWTETPSGAKVKRKFPAGVFEFTVGAEEGLGPYQMCSLFSPVLEFENQEAAVLTAEAALAAMFDGAINGEAPEKIEAAEPSGVSRRSLIFGGGRD